MFVLKSRMGLKMVHVGSKTRSQFQILEKPCVCSRGHIFSPIIMKLGQNVLLIKSWSCLKMGHFGSKTTSNLVKPCVHSSGHIFSLIIMKLGQNVCLHGISTRSLCQV